MKKLKRTYTRCAGLTALVLLALLIAGSFADLPISRFLYPGHESSFGQFFAAFGELPAFALLASCGVLLIVRRGEFRPELHMILLAFGVCLIAGSVFLSIHEATDNVPALPTAVALLVTLFVDALAAFAFLFMTRGCQAKTLLRFLCTVIFVCVGIMLLINIIKVPWGRARMRLIASTGNASYFTPWWKAGSSLKNQLVAEGVSSDEFRSFPSGHTACAACAMLAALLPTVSRRFRGKEKRLGLSGALWTAIVAFSRLRMGAHFLTDVTMAWLVTLGLTVLGVMAFCIGIGDGPVLIVGGLIVFAMGIFLAVYYLSFGIFYDGESFLMSRFGKKDAVHRYEEIVGQKLYVVQGGSIVAELYLKDGSTVSLQSTMDGVYPFLDTAFAGWCLQTGRDPESCDFHDPSKSLWFPPVEES